MSVESLSQAVNTVWTLMAAFLVFFMQAGFAMVEAGFTRAKNAGNIVLKNLMDFCAGTVAYWVVGFGLMFGASAAGLFGTTGFMVPSVIPSIEWTGLSVQAFWVFQVVFAGTAATIVSGAMAERTRFASYLLFSFLMAAFIYPIFGHWVWGGGWLSKMAVPMKDFAGSTVVHSVGGWAALAGCLVLGPRIGRFGTNGRAAGAGESGNGSLQGHSLTLAALGVFILWFGWFGFNPGSTLGASGELTDLIALVAANTNLAAATGALAALFLSKLHTGKFSVGSALNGALAGLVGITAGCAFVNNLGALVTGVLGGVVMYYGTLWLERLRIDDAVGAISVHGLAGAAGTLAVGLFDVETGLFFGGGWGQLGAQAIGVAAAFIWTFGSSYLAFRLIDLLIGVRVSPEEEVHGLDFHEHGVIAYPDFTQPEPAGAPAMAGAGGGR